MALTLRSIGYESLDCNSHPMAGFCSTKGLPMDPSLEDTPKSSFSKDTFTVEILSCDPQTVELVDLQVRGCQHLGLRSRGRSASSTVEGGCNTCLSSRGVVACWNSIPFSYQKIQMHVSIDYSKPGREQVLLFISM